VLRLHESGFPVYGFGGKKTPQPFVDACSPFIYIENLESGDADKTDSPAPSARKTKAQLRQDTFLVKLLRTAVEQVADDDGWANMGQVANYISNNNSSFSSVNYGYRRVSDLIRASELFKIEMRNGTAMYIKDLRN
jgi:OST-HTH/LOTUS domain